MNCYQMFYLAQMGRETVRMIRPNIKAESDSLILLALLKVGCIRTIKGYSLDIDKGSVFVVLNNKRIFQLERIV